MANPGGLRRPASGYCKTRGLLCLACRWKFAASSAWLVRKGDDLVQGGKPLLPKTQGLLLLGLRGDLQGEFRNFFSRIRAEV